jgi:hypothetical protein
VFTIVGLIVAVAAALLLLVAVLHAGSSGMQNSKASDAAAELAQLELGVQGLYSAQASFNSLTNTVALDAGTSVVPSSMDDGNGGIVNEWGGTVTLAGNGSEFTITETEVPQSACAVLATKATNPISVTVNGGGALSSPIDVGTVAADCSSNGSNNTLTFTFGH